METQPPAAVIAAAQAADALWHIPASVIIAQWALESDWGRREPPGSNNPFGEKAPAGTPGVSAATHEVFDGRAVDVDATFRAFPSLAAAFDFHAGHLATSRFYGPARACLPNVAGFCRGLTGVYATDPAYGGKLIDIINDSDLEAYDS